MDHSKFAGCKKHGGVEVWMLALVMYNLNSLLEKQGVDAVAQELMLI